MLDSLDMSRNPIGFSTGDSFVTHFLTTFDLAIDFACILAFNWLTFALAWNDSRLTTEEEKGN